MVTLVVAIAAVVVIPGAAAEDPITIQSVGASLTADLEYAQSASVANPADPVVVVFDAPNNRYYLAKASSPGTPIDRPGAPAGTKYEVKLNDASGTTDLDLTTQGVGSYVRFDAMGRLQQESDVVLKLVNSAGTIEIFISAQTGSVSAMGNASEEATVTTSVFVDPNFDPTGPEGAPAPTTAPRLDPSLSLATEPTASDDGGLDDSGADAAALALDAVITAPCPTSPSTVTTTTTTLTNTTNTATSTVNNAVDTTTSTVRSLLR